MLFYLTKNKFNKISEKIKITKIMFGKIIKFKRIFFLRKNFSIFSFQKNYISSNDLGERINSCKNLRTFFNEVSSYHESMENEHIFLSLRCFARLLKYEDKNDLDLILKKYDSMKRFLTTKAFDSINNIDEYGLIIYKM